MKIFGGNFELKRLDLTRSGQVDQVDLTTSTLRSAMDGSLIFCGIEFQIVGAANLKALRPTALAVKGTCNRLSEAERRGLGGLLSLISDERY